MFRIEEGGLPRFRCRVGHAWSAESLLARQGVALESALWMALRCAGGEGGPQHATWQRRATTDGLDQIAARFGTRRRGGGRAAELIRQLVESLGPVPSRAWRSRWCGRSHPPARPRRREPSGSSDDHPQPKG